MNENTIEGAAKVAEGRLESSVGAALDDVDMEARGAGLQLGGQVQRAVGAVQETLGDAVETSAAAASRARAAYDRVTNSARDIGGRVDPFVHNRPYAALALCAAAFLVVGLLIAGRGPRVIYVKPRD
jgi:uncharacterized protein YjbJ (UPF0337 family)